MRYIYFLVAIILTTAILPLEVDAQRRPTKTAKRVVTKKKVKKAPVKKTAYIRKKAKTVTKPVVKNPLVGVFLNPSVATVVPQCTTDSDRMVINIYFLELFTQSMKYEQGEFSAFRTDAASAVSVAGQLAKPPEKDPRWGSNFLNQRDLQLIQTFRTELQPDEMQFYPKLPQSQISTIVLRRSKWYQEDVSKSYELIRTHYGPNVKTNFVSECLTLSQKEPIQPS